MNVEANPNHPDGQLAVDLRNIGVLRGGRWILRNVNWLVRAGSCAAILGPNGSGKSTLARILAIHLWPTAGQCVILGERFGQTDLGELRRSVRLLQPAGPYDVDSTLTTRQVVLTGFFATLDLYDEPTAEMEIEANRVLAQVGMSALADNAYATLSSGERIRSLIARALVQKPRLLLLDEPTAGLDLLAREQVLATIEAMFQADPAPPTVILITHHVEELPPITSEILVLADGSPAASGPPRQVLSPELLSQVYKCPVQVRESAGRFYLEVHPDAWRQLI